MGGAGIKFSVAYLKSQPNDADCATHELFHVVQGGYMNYNSESFEGAICEGIADYARSVYGLYNSLQGWGLGNYNSSQTILTRYASNARFLTWINYNKNSESTYMLNKTMHNGTYTSDMWVQLTGMTSDQLWNAYAASPSIDSITLSTQKGETWGVTSGKAYKIVSVESGQVLSVANNSTASGANVQQGNYVEGNESQQWVFNYIGNGKYNIINKKSGKALDVAGSGNTNGTNVQQYDLNNGSAQKWVVFERGNQYDIFPECGNGSAVLDLSSSSHNAGANIQLWTWNKSNAQRFVLEPVEDSSAAGTLKPFERIEAEDFITSSTDIKVSIDESDSRSNGGNIGGLLAGAWTRYQSVEFDADATSIEFNYCNPSSDSYVNVYVDSMNSTPVGVIQTPHNSSNWNTYTNVKGDLSKKISKGTHDIYLEFKNSSMSGYTQNCDYFVFGKAASIVTYEAFDKIEAENFDEKSDAIIIDDTANASGGHNIGGVQRNTYIGFEKVNFAQPATYLQICYSGQSADATGQVEVYVDSMNGTPAGTVNVPPTGNNWSTFKTVKGKLSNAITKGEHKIYLKFVNDGSKAYVANADWFTFTTYPDSYDAAENIEAEAYTKQNGVIIDNDSNGAPNNIGNTNNGEWTEYDNVVFGKKMGEIVFKYSSKQGCSGNVLVCIDNKDATPVATMEVVPTGSGWTTYVEKTVKLDTPVDAGTHNVFLKFTSSGGNIVNIDWFRFNEYVEEQVDPNAVILSDKVKVEGYQISATLGGSRVIGSVEPTINGKNVVSYGLIYGLYKTGNKTNSIADDEMRVNSTNEFVKAYQTTSAGIMNQVVGDSSTATYFVRTMLFPAYTKDTFNARYKVRVYAALADGSYVYSSISDYSIYEIAKHLYDNSLMLNANRHQYLYQNILKITDSTYQIVEFIK